MISQRQLESVIADQEEVFRRKETGVPRILDFKKYLSTKQITVISGVRRCGKSTLLAQFARHFKRYYYLSFDDERLLGFAVSDFDALMAVFQKAFIAKVLFLDEIQNVPQWERFIRRLHDEGYKLFLTGSNARLLSSELSTHLTGRYFKVELYPFSFLEYLSLRQIVPQQGSRERARLLKALDEYVQQGGFPEYVKSGDVEHLKRTYEDILYRDVVARFHIRDTKNFKQLAQYLFTAIGSEVSYHALAKMLGIKSAMSVRKYLGYLQESWLVFELYKYDFSLKKQFVSDKKIYVIDNGMRNAVAFTFSEDFGKLLENMVFLELKRRGHELYYFKGMHECDFLVREKNKVIEAIQVTTVLMRNNRERELSGIREAMERCRISRGTIIVYDGKEEVIKEGRMVVHVVPLVQWLLEGSTDEQFDYLKVLERTQGAWEPETKEDKLRAAQRRRIELQASQRRKQAW